jgi:hypothetical protein
VSSTAILEVITGDRMTEIHLFDAKFNLVDKGVGGLRRQVLPGIYLVRARAGLDSQEKQVLLEAGPNPPVTFDQLSFPSPVPMPGTARSSDHHTKAAIVESRRVRAILGQGASIFVFSRDLGSRGGYATFSAPFGGNDFGHSTRNSGRSPGAICGELVISFLGGVQC